MRSDLFSFLFFSFLCCTSFVRLLDLFELRYANIRVCKTGQGVVRYVTGDQALPRYAEIKGWATDKDKNLNFKGEGFVACPHSIDGSWSLWLDVGLSQPGGNKDCLGFTARELENKKPVGCKYTQ